MTRHNTEADFWAKACKVSCGCWLWSSSLDSTGYGVAFLKPFPKAMKAHRVAWTLINGEIPRGLLVCHKCDIPACVNPEHLFLGTYKDNIQDSISKGRFAYGLNNGRSKLSEIDVMEIRRRCLTERRVDIAKDYGITPEHVYRVNVGKRR